MSLKKGNTALGDNYDTSWVFALTFLTNACHRFVHLRKTIRIISIKSVSSDRIRQRCFINTWNKILHFSCYASPSNKKKTKTKQNKNKTKQQNTKYNCMWSVEVVNQNSKNMFLIFVNQQIKLDYILSDIFDMIYVINTTVYELIINLALIIIFLV